MDQLPCVLFLTCSDTPPEDMIKLVMKTAQLPPNKKLDDGLYAYEWEIVNKYYSAKVNLCTVETTRALSPSFCELLQAVVLHFDSTRKDLFTVLEQWLTCISLLSPPLRIMVCTNIKNEPESDRKVTLTKWCVENDFDLVELEPIIDEDDNLENEPIGIECVLQTLNAHTWPNLVMNSPPRSRSPVLKASDLSSLDEPFLAGESLEKYLEEDDFSQLFAKFFQLKERVESLEGDDRKAAAEIVVKAFWNALGEDENEF